MADDDAAARAAMAERVRTLFSSRPARRVRMALTPGLLFLSNVPYLPWIL